MPEIVLTSHCSKNETSSACASRPQSPLLLLNYVNKSNCSQCFDVTVSFNLVILSVHSHLNTHPYLIFIVWTLAHSYFKSACVLNNNTPFGVSSILRALLNNCHVDACGLIGDKIFGLVNMLLLPYPIVRKSE